MVQPRWKKGCGSPKSYVMQYDPVIPVLKPQQPPVKSNPGLPSPGENNLNVQDVFSGILFSHKEIGLLPLYTCAETRCRGKVHVV